MKKSIVLSLIFMLAVAVSGCGSKDDVRGDITSNVESEVTEVTDEVAEEVVEVEEEFSIGSNDGNVYESEFIGFGYQLDEGWSFYSDEQIRELNNATADLAGEEYQKMLSDAEIIYDMFAVDSDGLNNINVNLEKVNPVQLLALNIAQNYETIIPMMQSTYENMGYSNFEYEISTITIDGKEVDAVHVCVEINDVQVYQTLFAKKCSGYLANVAVTTYFEDTTAQLIENIYWLD